MGYLKIEDIATGKILFEAGSRTELVERTWIERDDQSKTVRSSMEFTESWAGPLYKEPTASLKRKNDAALQKAIAKIAKELTRKK